MSNKLKTLRSYRRIVALFFVVLGGIILGGVLPSLQTINFLHAGVSLTSYVLLFTVVLLITLHFIHRLRYKKNFYLKFSDARKMTLLCQTPRTTRYLRALYINWEKQHSEVLTGANSFADFIKEQEKKGVLKYVNGKWHITKKGFEVVANQLLYDPCYWET